MTHIEDIERIAREIQSERLRHVRNGLAAGSPLLHNTGVLARAGAAYALMVGTRDWSRGKQCGLANPPIWFPWERSKWRPLSPRADLIRATAMLVGEIEIMDRADTKGGGSYA